MASIVPARSISGTSLNQPIERLRQMSIVKVTGSITKHSAWTLFSSSNTALQEKTWKLVHVVQKCPNLYHVKFAIVSNYLTVMVINELIVDTYIPHVQQEQSLHFSYTSQMFQSYLNLSIRKFCHANHYMLIVMVWRKSFFWYVICTKTNYLPEYISTLILICETNISNML